MRHSVRDWLLDLVLSFVTSLPLQLDIILKKRWLFVLPMVRLRYMLCVYCTFPVTFTVIDTVCRNLENLLNYVKLHKV